ncbi:hypothetical protein XFF7767_1060001 [Xanthomonas citri pv. fuscans]|nr:hypothetical protein XFF7767_1060001 [Xanthomonas citri pv. fuscans]
MRWTMRVCMDACRTFRRLPAPNSACCRPITPPATSSRLPSAFRCASASTRTSRWRRGCGRACRWWWPSRPTARSTRHNLHPSVGSNAVARTHAGGSANTPYRHDFAAQTRHSRYHAVMPTMPLPSLHWQHLRFAQLSTMQLYALLRMV